jgi:hypothetical protein
LEEKLETSLRIAIRFLEEHGYRYAIVGGIALAHWGVVRMTQDVDIKVLVPDYDYNAFRSALQKAFPELALQQPPTNPLIMTMTMNDVIVDFLLAIPGYEELIIVRAIMRNLDDFQAWICTAEDLIIQKVVAGRGKDWLDVESLLIEQWGKLDEVYIRDWLGQFAEALEIPEMLEDFERIRKKTGDLFDQL